MCTNILSIKPRTLKRVLCNSLVLMKLAQSDFDHKEFKGVDMGVDQKFWNYSHISLNKRWNYIKLVQSKKLTFPNFAMMFEWQSMQGEMWLHRLMTSCNSDPAKKMMEIFLSKRRTMNRPAFTGMCRLASFIFRLKWTWLSILGANNSLNMQFWNF